VLPSHLTIDNMDSRFRGNDELQARFRGNDEPLDSRGADESAPYSGNDVPSRGRRISGSPAFLHLLRQGHDPLHLFLLGKIGRVDQDRVARLERVGGVAGVALDEEAGFVGDLCVGG